MKKIWTNIKQFFCDLYKKYKEYREQKRYQRIINESYRIYQVKEVKGEVWITYGGEPVVSSSLLKYDFLETLKELREKYAANKVWHEHIKI